MTEEFRPLTIDDYYPDNEADALIRELSGKFKPGDYSSVINRIVSEWAEQCHRN